MGIENAKLFDDVRQMNYESILSSMHDAVLTFDETMLLKLAILGLKILSFQCYIRTRSIDFVCGPNEWLLKKLETVEDTEEFLDAEIQVEGETLSVNITLTIARKK